MWNFKLGKFTSFREDLAQTDWEPCFTSNDPNQITESWNNKFLEIAKKHVPCKKVLVRPNSMPWYTNNLRRKARAKNRAQKRARSTKRDSDWDSYKELRNTYNEEVNIARAKYQTTNYETLANASLMNPKRWWDLSKKVLGISKSSYPSLIVNDGELRESTSIQ